MVTQRRLSIAAIAATIVLFFGDELVLRLNVLAAWLLATGYAVWSAGHGKWTRHDRPAAAPDPRAAELVSARVGEPAHAVLRFVLHAQHAPHERWHGEEPLWIAVSDTWIWLLHQTSDGDVGGVKSRFSRTGMHSRWTDHRARSYHVARALLAR